MSRDGAVVRALASHQCGLGWITGLGINMWVEFVVGSHPCSKRFSLVTLIFPSPQKPTFPNSNFIQIIVKHFSLSQASGSGYYTSTSRVIDIKLITLLYFESHWLEVPMSHQCHTFR